MARKKLLGKILDLLLDLALLYSSREDRRIISQVRQDLRGLGGD